MKGKNKLVPRLLGITKESVMRVDEKTKEVIQEWSLTNIKRWAASPKSFTLVSSSGEEPAPVPAVGSQVRSGSEVGGRGWWPHPGPYASQGPSGSFTGPN